MVKLSKIITSYLVAWTLATGAFAAPEALDSQRQLDLRDYTGMTFLQAMILEEDGIVDHFEADYAGTFSFASWEEVSVALENFDSKNKNRVLRDFGYDLELLEEFTKALRSDQQTFTPENISDKIAAQLRKMNLSGNRYALGQFFAIASGAGTLIHIDANNYYYNIGYYEGEVRSGRSYGATLLHNANDASHLMYLHELERFLENDNDYRQFYKGIMDFLVSTDVSVFDDPSFNKYGEAVLCDYITVYTAELRRHLMKNLHPSRAPWGNDMSEATFLSLFNVKSRLMMLEGQLTEASIEEHWALSRSGSGRSGFGINRRDRRALQMKITNYYRNHEDASKRAVLSRVAELIDLPENRDVYRGVMEFLNNRRNLSNPERVAEVGNELSQAFVEFLMQVNEDTSAIVATLQE